MREYKTCSFCQGFGSVNVGVPPLARCPHCGGTGKVLVDTPGHAPRPNPPGRPTGGKKPNPLGCLIAMIILALLIYFLSKS